MTWGSVWSIIASILIINVFIVVHEFGHYITGKKLGVIGLGAIGGMVANTMRHLGMNVIGHDPYLSVDAAWNISRDVEKAASYDDIYKVADYITLHVPSTPDTKGMINAETIAKMKDGVHRQPRARRPRQYG